MWELSAAPANVPVVASKVRAALSQPCFVYHLLLLLPVGLLLLTADAPNLETARSLAAVYSFVQLCSLWAFWMKLCCCAAPCDCWGFDDPRLQLCLVIPIFCLCSDWTNGGSCCLQPASLKSSETGQYSVSSSLWVSAAVHAVWYKQLRRVLSYGMAVCSAPFVLRPFYAFVSGAICEQQNPGDAQRGGDGGRPRALAAALMTIQP